MRPDPNYVKAPPGWSYTDRNPFSRDGSYGQKWSAFCLMDRQDDQFMTGQSGHGPFSARFGRRVKHLEHRLADYLLYENTQGRTVIVSFPEYLDADAFIAGAITSTPEASIVRPEDPPIVIHATTREAWASIQVEGELKAASQLARQNRGPRAAGEPGQVAEHLGHEPPEYSDYIMFGELDSCVPEMVVASYWAETFVLEENAVFTPGMRLYFDNHRLIRDGLGARDGLHVMKVRRRLPLKPYLLAAIGVDDVDPQGKVRSWTIGAFVDKANEEFRRRIS